MKMLLLASAVVLLVGCATVPEYHDAPSEWIGACKP